MLLFFSGCSEQSQLSKDEYVSWLNDKEEKIYCEKTDHLFDYTLRYKPSSSWRLSGDKGADSLVYFELWVRPSDKQTALRHQVADLAGKFIYDYSFLQQEIVLKQEQKVFPCVVLFAEPIDELRNSQYFLLGFEGIRQDGAACSVEIKPNGLFKGGMNFIVYQDESKIIKE